MSVEKNVTYVKFSFWWQFFTHQQGGHTEPNHKRSDELFVFYVLRCRNSIFLYVCSMCEKYYLTPVCRFRKLWSSLASSTFDLNNRHVQNTITVKHTTKARNTDPLMNKRRPSNWRSNSVYCCSISKDFTWLLVSSHPPLHLTSLASS